jgi:hypothetical protein
MCFAALSEAFNLYKVIYFIFFNFLSRKKKESNENVRQEEIDRMSV